MYAEADPEQRKQQLSIPDATKMPSGEVIVITCTVDMRGVGQGTIDVNQLQGSAQIVATHSHELGARSRTEVAPMFWLGMKR